MFSLLNILLFTPHSFSLDPEASMTVVRISQWIFSKVIKFKDVIIKYWGYPIEKFDIFTNDGFILDLYRIPHGRNETARLPSSSSTPLLLVPGLFASASAFLLNPPESSPGMYLADAGFDVFIMSNRGTRYGMRHTRLAPSDRDFWKFTIDDYANGDLPVVIDRVLAISGQHSLNLIAHSQV
ncbi:hypothetical protein PMAYCL1PPCAC_17059, partial [Pristionchus mayeri]